MQTVRDLDVREIDEIDPGEAKRANRRATKRQLHADDEDYNGDEVDQEDDDDLPSYKNRINFKARRCSKCNTKQTTCWRRDMSTNAILCNSCGLMSQESHHQIKEDEDDESDTSTYKASSRQRRRSYARSSPEIQPNGMFCDHCGATSSPVWRRKDDSEKRAYLCNACGIYLKNTQRMRPSYLLARALRKSHNKETTTDNNDEPRLATKKEKPSTRHWDHSKQPKIEEAIVEDTTTTELEVADQRCSSPQTPPSFDRGDLVVQQFLFDSEMLSSDDLYVPSIKDHCYFSNANMLQLDSQQQYCVENYASNLYLQQPLTPQSTSSSLSFMETIDQDEFSLASNSNPDLCSYNVLACKYSDRTTPYDIFFGSILTKDSD